MQVICYGLQVHSNTNNFIMFVSGFRKTTATIANRGKDYIIPPPKPKVNNG